MPHIEDKRILFHNNGHNPGTEVIGPARISFSHLAAPHLIVLLAIESRLAVALVGTPRGPPTRPTTYLGHASIRTGSRYKRRLANLAY